MEEIGEILLFLPMPGASDSDICAAENRLIATVAQTEGSVLMSSGKEWFEADVNRIRPRLLQFQASEASEELRLHNCRLVESRKSTLSDQAL